eukprot:341969-Chlamydomonas_euryale.AAC.3
MHGCMHVHAFVEATTRAWLHARLTPIPPSQCRGRDSRKYFRGLFLSASAGAKERPQGGDAAEAAPLPRSWLASRRSPAPAAVLTASIPVAPTTFPFRDARATEQSCQLTSWTFLSLGGAAHASWACGAGGRKP